MQKETLPLQKEKYALQKEEQAYIYAKTFPDKLFSVCTRFLQGVYLQKQAYTLQKRMQIKCTSKQMIIREFILQVVFLQKESVPLQNKRKFL